MKRLKIFKAYFVLWLFVYFIAISNLETFKLYFLSTLTFNIAIVAILSIGTFMIFKAAKELTMVTGTFGVLMYKRGDLSFYLKGIEKVFPSTIAEKILSRAKSGTMLFTKQESDDILAWLEEKYSNQNKYNNFFIGTVLMIGLLGTFAGLLGSIASMGAIVSSLAGSNVDIGKIMADFAIPLSSMAVGFGSSLFGVISAILLSIKGYLLNKAQEALLSGVENWLQSKTIEQVSEEDKSGSLMPASSMEAHQKSYMDIFVEQIASLNHEIKEASMLNREYQQTLVEMVNAQKIQAKEEQALLASMKGALSDIALHAASQTKESQKIMHSLEQMQETQKEEASRLLSHTQQEREALEKREHTITNMVLKQEKKAQESQMKLFEVVDAMSSMDKNIQHRLNKLEKTVVQGTHHDKESHTLSESMDFMKKHFSSESKA